MYNNSRQCPLVKREVKVQQTRNDKLRPEFQLVDEEGEQSHEVT